MCLEYANTATGSAVTLRIGDIVGYGITHKQRPSTSTSSRYVAIVDLFSVLCVLTFNIRSLTASEVVLNCITPYPATCNGGIWLAFPCDNYALVG